VLAERAKALEILSPKGLKVKALRNFKKTGLCKSFVVQLRKWLKYSQMFVDLPFSQFSHENVPLVSRGCWDGNFSYDIGIFFSWLSRPPLLPYMVSCDHVYMLFFLSNFNV
jgi:hypothetical protein